MSPCLGCWVVVSAGSAGVGVTSSSRSRSSGCVSTVDVGAEIAGVGGAEGSAFTAEAVLFFSPFARHHAMRCACAGDGVEAVGGWREGKWKLNTAACIKNNGSKSNTKLRTKSVSDRYNNPYISSTTPHVPRNHVLSPWPRASDGQRQLADQGYPFSGPRLAPMHPP